jgi:hypothetical protein
MDGTHYGFHCAVTDGAIQVPVIAGVVSGVIILVVIGIPLILIKNKRFVYLHHSRSNDKCYGKFIFLLLDYGN